MPAVTQILLFLLEHLRIEPALLGYESCRNRLVTEPSDNNSSSNSLLKAFTNRYRDIELCVPPTVLKTHGVMADFVFVKAICPDTLTPGSRPRRSSLLTKIRSPFSGSGSLTSGSKAADCFSNEVEKVSE